MRVRVVDGKVVALCAAEFPAESDDLYIDDAQDHAIRVKLREDWTSEGYFIDPRGWIERQAELEGALTEALLQLNHGVGVSDLIDAQIERDAARKLADEAVMALLRVNACLQQSNQVPNPLWWKDILDVWNERSWK